MTDERDLRLLKQLRDTTTPPDAEVVEARLALQAAIQDELHTGRPAVRRPLRRLVPAIGLVGAAAVLLGAVLVVQTLAPPPAVATLEEIARVAEVQPVLTPASGESLYFRSDRVDLVQFDGADLPDAGIDVVSFLLPQRREVWLQADGRLRIRTEVGEPLFFSATVETAFFAAGFDADYGVGMVDDVVVDVAPPPLDLPADPELLRAALLAESPPEEDGRSEAELLFDRAGDLMRETAAGPELRAAVVRMLAGLEGELTVDERDGVVDVSVDLDAGVGMLRHRLSFDEATGHLVAEEVTILQAEDPAVPVGTAILDVAYNIPELVAG